jgi:hypothetical protein
MTFGLRTEAAAYLERLVADCMRGESYEPGQKYWWVDTGGKLTRYTIICVN